VRRREFVTLLGSAAAAWPFTPHAEQATLPIIGYLSSGTSAGFARLTGAFRRGVNEAGLIEGPNVAIEYRYAGGQYERLPALAANLVRRRVTVIAATTTPAAVAAKQATMTIPIVFSIGADPIALGLVVSLGRPSGNVTGVSNYLSELGAKRLQLLREMIPNAAILGMLVNPNFPDAKTQVKDIEDAARAFRQELYVLRATSEGDLETAFATFDRRRIDGLIITVDPFFNSRRDGIVALAARHNIPAMYFEREFVSAGGLMSYAPNLADGYRQAGVYAGRIVRGEKVIDLPVLQPTKFELVINLKTAKALGIAVPESILERANEVIE